MYYLIIFGKWSIPNMKKGFKVMSKILFIGAIMILISGCKVYYDSFYTDPDKFIIFGKWSIPNMKKGFKVMSEILFIGAIMILISGCKVYYDSFYTDPDKCYKEACAQSVDVIIVPGYPHTNNKWSIPTKIRVRWAVYLYQQGITKNIIFSGSAVYSPYVESKIMAMYAEKLGVPKENIFTETQAEHSTENLYYSYLLAREKGFKSIALATDVAQSSFLKSFKRKFNLSDLRFIPIVYDTLVTINTSDPEIDQEKAFVPDFVSITDREGIFKRLAGTRGRKVKKMIREEKRTMRKNNNSNRNKDFKNGRHHD